MPDELCSIQFCDVSTAELVAVLVLSVLHVGYLAFLQLRRSQKDEYVFVRGMVLAHLVGRVYTALGIRTNGLVYGLFVALLPVTLICASLQWANSVVKACLNGMSMSASWMPSYIRYTRVCQVGASIVFPVLFVGFNTGVSFHCNPPSLAFLIAMTAYLYLVCVPLLVAHAIIRREVVKVARLDFNTSNAERSTQYEATLARIQKISISVAFLLVFWTGFVVTQFIVTTEDTLCDLPMILVLAFGMAFFVSLLLWYTDVRADPGAPPSKGGSSSQLQLDTGQCSLRPQLSSREATHPHNSRTQLSVMATSRTVSGNAENKTADHDGENEQSPDTVTSGVRVTAASSSAAKVEGPDVFMALHLAEDWYPTGFSAPASFATRTMDYRPICAPVATAAAAAAYTEAPKASKLDDDDIEASRSVVKQT